MAEPPVCPEIGERMVRGTRPLTISYKGRSRLVDMPGWYAATSGESVHTREDMKVSDLALVSLKTIFQNLAMPNDVRREDT